MFEATVRELIAGRLPGYRVEQVDVLGAGLDNTAYVVNREVVVRFAKDVESAAVEREARLLKVVGGISPLAVPKPLFTETSLGCLAYRMVPGTPLIEFPGTDGVHVARQLGAFLAALHTAPGEIFEQLITPDVAPLAEWLEEAAEGFDGVRRHVPAGFHPMIARFLSEEPPAEPESLVFSHNDLGIEHVMVDASGTATGVIDWTDAALVDRAYDFGLLYRDLGPDALTAALAAYPLTDDQDVAERARFYARCSLFEDLAFGLETSRDRYLTKSLRALDWLFPV